MTKISIFFLLLSLSLIASCDKVDDHMRLFEDRIDDLNEYTKVVANIDLLAKKENKIFIFIRYSPCDCIETAIRLAAIGTHHGATVLLVGKYQKDFVGFQQYIKSFRSGSVYSDLNGRFDQYDLYAFPSTFIVEINDGEILFASEIDSTTKEEITEHFNWPNLVANGNLIPFPGAYSFLR